jgi:hypothetical protein
MRYLLAICALLALAGEPAIQAQSPDRQALLASIDSRARQYADVAMKIWVRGSRHRQRLNGREERRLASKACWSRPRAWR